MCAALGVVGAACPVPLLGRVSRAVLGARASAAAAVVISLRHVALARPAHALGGAPLIGGGGLVLPSLSPSTHGVLARTKGRQAGAPLCDVPPKRPPAPRPRGDGRRALSVSRRERDLAPPQRVSGLWTRWLYHCLFSCSFVLDGLVPFSVALVGYCVELVGACSP